MNSLHHRPDSTLERRSWRRPAPSALVSVAIHVVLAIVVWNAVQMPAVFDRLLVRDRAARPIRERVEYVALRLPAAPAPAAEGARPRGSTRASVRRPEAPAAVPLVAPAAVPAELPPPTTGPEKPVSAGGVTGPLRGGSGATRGAQPTFDDPRVWPGDPEFIYAPKTDQERLDSSLIATLRRHQDSLARSAFTPNKFERGDWTFERNGQKYGIDQQFIRLGKFSIPTALLAMLPLNRMQGNPVAMERERNAAYMRADILYHAQAAMNEEEFRKAVKAIRDRKEREKRSGTARPVVTTRSDGGLTSPGERPPE